MIAQTFVVQEGVFSLLPLSTIVGKTLDAPVFVQVEFLAAPNTLAGSCQNQQEDIPLRCVKTR